MNLFIKSEHAAFMQVYFQEVWKMSFLMFLQSLKLCNVSLFHWFFRVTHKPSHDLIDQDLLHPSG